MKRRDTCCPRKFPPCLVSAFFKLGPAGDMTFKTMGHLPWAVGATSSGQEPADRLVI